MKSVTSADDILELVLPLRASLARMDRRLLKPSRLPNLWLADDGDAFKPLGIEALIRNLSGGHVATLPSDGYEEELPTRALGSVAGEP